MKQRQKGAFERLEAQLASGVKTAKKTGIKVPLTDADKLRIESEMATLKKRM